MEISVMLLIAIANKAKQQTMHVLHSMRMWNNTWGAKSSVWKRSPGQTGKVTHIGGKYLTSESKQENLMISAKYI